MRRGKNTTNDQLLKDFLFSFIKLTFILAVCRFAAPFLRKKIFSIYEENIRFIFDVGISYNVECVSDLRTGFLFSTASVSKSVVIHNIFSLFVLLDLLF